MRGTEGRFLRQVHRAGSIVDRQLNRRRARHSVVDSEAPRADECGRPRGGDRRTEGDRIVGVEPVADAAGCVWECFRQRRADNGHPGSSASNLDVQQRYRFADGFVSHRRAFVGRRSLRGFVGFGGPERGDSVPIVLPHVGNPRGGFSDAARDILRALLLHLGARDAAGEVSTVNRRGLDGVLDNGVDAQPLLHGVRGACQGEAPLSELVERLRAVVGGWVHNRVCSAFGRDKGGIDELRYAAVDGI
mmetsp:Transcript_24700/g.76385  ORF Transcript_24700/g.76385 Transcript_24700/m.76385 type:complete len:247 (-) Transcript_24700:861-1601(-)